MSSDLLTVLLHFQPDSDEVQQCRDYDQAVRGFVSQLNNISASHWAKSSETSQDVLEVLDPTVNSIAYAFALRHRITAVMEKRSVPDSLQPGGPLWNKLVLFLETFDPIQMRYAGHEWRKLVEFTEQIARGIGSPSLAIAPIRSAMNRLDPTMGTFTTSHLNLIRLCMETRSYSAAEPVLDNYIHSIPCKMPSCVREGLEYSVPCADVVASGEYIHQNSGHSDKITVTDLQEYYLLGGMAYLGLRKFKRAQQMLEHVLIAPSSNVANGFMLEAYKKWVLVSCLVDSIECAASKSSQARVIPRTVNGVAIKLVKSASRAYDAVADAYAQWSNMSKLKAQIKFGAEIWAEDGNSGLVNELLSSQMRLYVARLSRTFSAIPVSNIATYMGGKPDEVAQYLETLMQDGHVNARLEGGGGGGVGGGHEADTGVVLRFYLDQTQGPLAKSETQQQQALFEQTERTNRLAQQVRDADYRLTLSKEYVENLKRISKKQSAGGDAMDTAWDDDGIEAEEDIMVDLH